MTKGIISKETKININISFYHSSEFTESEYNEFIEFMKKLKERFKKSNLLLMLSIKVTKNYVHERQHNALFKHFDFINFVYYYRLIQDKNTYKLNDGLGDRNITQIEKSISNIVESGVSPSKIVLFLSLLGLMFSMPVHSNAERFVGFISYDEFCQHRGNYTKFSSGTGSIIVSKGKTFFLYENARMIANHVRFGIRKGLAGFNVAYIQLDDYTTNCGIDVDIFDDFNIAKDMKLTVPGFNRTDFPAMRSINAAITLSLMEIQKTKKNVTKTEINHNGNSPLVVLNRFCLLMAFVSILISLPCFTRPFGICYPDFHG